MSQSFLAWKLCAGLLAMAFFSGPVYGHAFSPNSLTIQHQKEGLYSFHFRAPDISLQEFHGKIDVLGCGDAQPVSSHHRDRQIDRRWTARCPSLPSEFQITAPSQRPLIVRIRDLGATELVYVMPPGQQRLSLSNQSESTLDQLSRYYFAGLGHLSQGIDHLCFVLLLLFMVRGRQLIWSLSSFTLGHSLSLFAAGLWRIELPAIFIEPAIAASILMMAWRVAAQHCESSSQSGQHFSQRAMLSIGCIHGFGFSGGLLEFGVAGTDFVTAIAGFNLGIETGQLIFVGLALSTASVLTRFHQWTQRLKSVTVYAIGALSVSWLIDRLA